MDRLEEVLAAVESKLTLDAPTCNVPTIQMISWRTFGRTNYERIRWFQSMVSHRFNVRLIAIGGGYGCTKIIFAVEAHSQEEAKNFILEMMGSKEFRELGVEAEFRVQYLIHHIFALI